MVLTVGSRSHLLRVPGGVWGGAHAGKAAPCTTSRCPKGPWALTEARQEAQGHPAAAECLCWNHRLITAAGTEACPSIKLHPEPPVIPLERDWKTKQGAEKGKKGDPAYGSNSYGMDRVSRTAPKSSTSAEGTRRICFPKHKAKP